MLYIKQTIKLNAKKNKKILFISLKGYGFPAFV